MQHLRGVGDTKDLFRPEFEFYIGSTYAAASAATLAMSNGVGLAPYALSALSLGLAAKYTSKAIPRIRQKQRLKNNYFWKKPLAELRAFNVENPERVFLGKGFEWGTEHAALYERINSMSSDLKELHLPLIFEKGALEDTQVLGGKPYIHGIGDEKEIDILASAFFGHTIILGLPGTGKTTLLNMLSTGTLNRQNFNIIVDPKPDADWRRRMKTECEIMGVPFYDFSTSNASKSVRIDVLKDYEKVTDIPSRIMDVTKSTAADDGDSFKEFAWKCINQVVQGMHYVHIPAQITTVSQYLRYDYMKLAEKCLTKFFINYFGSEQVFMNKRSNMNAEGVEAGSLGAMIAYYMDEQKVPSEKRHSSVNLMMDFVMHDRSHRSKMLASTDPLFDQLTASPLDRLLSPNLKDELSDSVDGKILNLEEMLSGGGCLYISLNSMGDSKLSGNIAKLILSAISSVASRRYSQDNGKGRRVSLFVDEAHAALNEKLIDLMAVGRGANFEVFLSTQTANDLEAKTDAATANRVLGLASNMFALRVADTKTKEYIASNFDEVNIQTISYAKGDRAGGSSSLIGDAATTFTENIGTEKVIAFPPGAQGNMPTLQCIARMQDGKKYKLRIPILLESQHKEKVPIGKRLLNKLAGVA
ncbi:conjugative transfer system coupling protein TraD [Vibrio parahaemolyticus]|uniref:TraG-D_C domain-containing protein n=1 Tax=Vibrio jasicida TaxID=766224 RepID=A0AAU9QT64_9VIBR|nr:conjugative transfer system coupling protein TraD [Vibrio parahaemolyticus]ELA8176727.1 conjugative transfer system coupling protein TraD [Vibrio alginolyticus]CAH1598864.1 TraG-D_C domain-containing protein [Vibrio jasicida]EJC7176166.1 conjugative transfer system coupling protein TraD [Vibrio parahaemolyticus]EJE4724605.1 conjugative transfer system coupling protein TraD [Vibrio parahaemolyticus]